MLNTSGENVWTLLGTKGGMQQNNNNEEEENSAKAEDCHEVCLDLTREEVVTLEEDESDFSDECEMDFDVSKDLWVKKQRNSSWVEVHIRISIKNV